MSDRTRWFLYRALHRAVETLELWNIKTCYLWDLICMEINERYLIDWFAVGILSLYRFPPIRNCFERFLNAILIEKVISLTSRSSEAKYRKTEEVRVFIGLSFVANRPQYTLHCQPLGPRCPQRSTVLHRLRASLKVSGLQIAVIEANMLYNVANSKVCK
jgi:hypothetical protein